LLWSILVVGSALQQQQLVGAERAYPLGCSGKPPSYYDYENFLFPPPGVSLKTTKDFQILRRLGSGKFSDVFEAVDMDLERQLTTTTAASNNKIENTKDTITGAVNPRTLVVLKCLKPVSDRKIRRELLVLSHCKCLPNLVQLLGVVVPETPSPYLPPMPSLILQHAGVHSQWLCHGRGIDPTSAFALAHDNVNDNGNNQYLSEYEIKYYVYHLLVALDALHASGIMHRDVKPRNVLINKERQQRHPDLDPALLLIDLGLADMYLPNTRYNVRVASRHYKSPELLVGYALYDYAIDMWGVGCILAGLLLRREPFFRGRDNQDQLGKIIAVLGTGDLLSYMTKYKIELTPEIRKVIAKYVIRGGRKKAWTDISVPADCPKPSDEGLDLLDNLLVYDHFNRLTARQAMLHPFFDAVRDRVITEINIMFPHAGNFRDGMDDNVSGSGATYYYPSDMRDITGWTSYPPSRSG
jgi:casein kinase II subunit alpha